MASRLQPDGENTLIRNRPRPSPGSPNVAVHRPSASSYNDAPAARGDVGAAEVTRPRCAPTPAPARPCPRPADGLEENPCP
ncbi:hypothetical protein CCE01nite_09170 [Cellulomonas cellasea]|uniref:Uncharacterized protein n=1 Tax=Cellulomonas cellasea TaxID=43670 RepID=A0A4Y3KVT3_9CELL|nr:hypothetical protein CCE01nite_09170 [Cellulomonas cellasea]